MSELMNNPVGRKDLRRQLLTTVSALAAFGSVYASDEVKAAEGDSDHSTIWIELGGQLERMDDSQQRFAPPFAVATPRPPVETISPLSVERPPLFSYAGEGKLSFEPDGTGWVFSAGVRIGRSNGGRHVHQQTYAPAPYITLPSGYVITRQKNGAEAVDTKTRHNESDTVVDFQAGRDVGLGLFGNRGTSVFGLGVRFAQFSSKSTIALKSSPDFHFNYRYITGLGNVPFYSQFHSNTGQMNTSRSFRGVGPTLSWNASAPVVGDADRGEVTFDWGLNAAVLLGRQKAAVHHQTTGRFRSSSYNGAPQTTSTHSTNHARSRSITVPNVGGFSGVSVRYANARVSFGYRADFFYGAMDGGIDAAKKENIGFYGPFASVSVGIGG